MADSFLDFVKSLPEHGNVQTVTVDELDEEAFKHGRITSTGGRSFYSNVRNRSAGIAVVFGSERVATKKFNPAQQRIRDNKDKTLEEVRKYLLRAPLLRVQRTIGDNSNFKPQVQPLHFSPASGQCSSSLPLEPHPPRSRPLLTRSRPLGNLHPRMA